MLRDEGIYHCADAAGVGLAVSNEEASRLVALATERGLRAKIHPRTFLLETRRRALVVLDWHVAARSCPFLVDLRCSAYDARPLVCRAFPVLGASPFALAPLCPEMPVSRGLLRVETRARRAIEETHAQLDERAWRLLGAPGARFAKGLPAREVSARRKRYRVVAAEEFARTLATS